MERCTTSQVASAEIFLKLKTTKTPKSDFDFSNNNTKSLSNIIELIKRKEIFNKKEKKKKEDFEYFLLKNNRKEIMDEIFNVYSDYDIKLKEPNKLNINNNENKNEILLSSNKISCIMDKNTCN